MTTLAAKIKKSYTGDGTTQSFAIDFPYLAETDIRVYVSDGTNLVLKTLGTDYSVVQAAQQATQGGKKNSIKFGTAPANTRAIKFVRNTPSTRPATDPNPQIGHLDQLRALYVLQEIGGQNLNAFQDSFGQVALLAGTALSFELPRDATLDWLVSEVLKVVTTGGPITAEVNGVAVTGLSVSVADGAIVGTVAKDAPTATTTVRAGSIVTITPDALFATAGDVKAKLEMTPLD